MTLFSELVETSARVTATSARSAKVAALADLLRRLEPDEVAPTVALLSGEARQGRIGVGWATLAALASVAGGRAVAHRRRCRRCLGPTGGHDRRGIGRRPERGPGRPVRAGDRGRGRLPAPGADRGPAPGRPRRGDARRGGQGQRPPGGGRPAGGHAGRRPEPRRRPRPHAGGGRGRRRGAGRHRAAAPAPGPAHAGGQLARRREPPSRPPGWRRWSGSSTAPASRSTATATRSASSPATSTTSPSACPASSPSSARFPPAAWSSTARRWAWTRTAAAPAASRRA